MILFIADINNYKKQEQSVHFNTTLINQSKSPDMGILRVCR